MSNLIFHTPMLWEVGNYTTKYKKISNKKLKKFELELGMISLMSKQLA
jgi:hypothetical protein